MLIAAPRGRRGWWRRAWIAVVVALRGVVLLEDQPRRLGLGAAAGILASALPIVGQTFIGMILARLLGGNVLASIPWSWISNPLTTLPLWYAGYRIGFACVPGGTDPISYVALGQLAARIGEAGILPGLALMAQLVGDLLLPLWLGCLVLGLAMAIPGYVAIHRITTALQERRLRLRASWRMAMPTLAELPPHRERDSAIALPPGNGLDKPAA